MAETEYIFMEIARGIKLDDVWLDLREEEISLVLRQLVQLESMVAGGQGILLEDERFCVGADTSFFLLHAFLKAVQKEVAYLGQFGQPLLLFRRVRREGYRHQERSPSDRIENLNRNETKQSRAEELHRHRLTHYHYVKNTEERNELHHAAILWACSAVASSTMPVGKTRAEGCADRNDRDAPCSVVFDAEDVCEMMKREADEGLKACHNIFGFGLEG
ncbi:hypothetical protein J132_00468 [Termitomyces sp. J132]|nr:hypothetical protein J132_00468 [Termitomyces sp. J132]